MDPNIGKATGRERNVAPWKESLPTSCGPHRASDKNTLLQEADASAKRNLISVGGCADTPLDLAAGGNADGKRPCLGNGQTEGHGWGRFVGGTWMGASRRISGQ